MIEKISLPLRPLGETGLLVSPVCIGCAPLADMPEIFTYSVQEDQALATIRAIFASPINFLDTAASYGDGESERRLGIVLREMGGLPEGFVLASKADRDLHTGDFSGEQMLRSVERSLRLLGLDQLQLLYLHDPEYTPFEQAMAPGGAVEALQRCQREGLVAHLGVAGGPIDMMKRFVSTDLFEVAISHNRYTLLDTEAASFWEICKEHNVAAVNAAPYSGGMLAKGPASYARYIYADAPAEIVKRAFALQAICERYHVPLAAAALQFSLRHPDIISTIVGVTRPERLDETLQLAQLTIPEALWDELAAV